MSSLITCSDGIIVVIDGSICKPYVYHDDCMLATKALPSSAKRSERQDEMLAIAFAIVQVTASLHVCFLDVLRRDCCLPLPSRFESVCFAATQCLFFAAGAAQGGIGSIGSVDGLRRADRGLRTGRFLSQAGQASVGMPG